MDNDPSSHSFAQWLLDIGHGNGGQATDQNQHLSVEIPNNMLCRDEEDLIDLIYSSMNDGLSCLSPDYFYERVILAPLTSAKRSFS
jgi:PIF1-like helicase